jgi:hypothetical protein
MMQQARAAIGPKIRKKATIWRLGESGLLETDIDFDKDQTFIVLPESVCDLAMQPLPGGDWAISEHPDDDDRRRWVNYSEGALRWLIGEQDPGARGP